MNNIEHFKKKVAEHASRLDSDQIGLFQLQSCTGECVSLSYEVFRGYLERHSLADFVEMAVSRNAIRPDEYLSDLLQGTHEIIGSLLEGKYNNAEGTPIYFFQDKGIYAAAVSENEVLDAWMSWPCYPVNW